MPTPNPSSPSLAYSRISCFDLDHTLLSVNSSFSFGAYLYRQGFFPFHKMLYCVSCYFFHKIGILSINDLQQKIFNSFFLGNSLNTIQAHVCKYLDHHLTSHYYDPAMKKFLEAKARGDYIVILSSSPDFIVGPIAERLGVNAWLASEYCIDALQCFTKIIRYVQGKDKAEYLTDLSLRMGILLKNTTAFSDSILDLPLLEVAGEAIGVNPDRKLRRVCLQNNWEIL